MTRLWAVTAYFNPLDHETRRLNFRTFREGLGVPLLAIELGFGGRFDLGPTDADVLLRRTGRDTLWHKERLLNLAFQALPRECDHVAWVDADLLFQDESWPERTAEALERYRLVQPFSRFFWLGEGEQAEATATREPDGSSLAHLLTKGVLSDDHWRVGGTSFLHRYTPGMAWAAHREDLDAVGLYDALVLGSGDRAFLSAACGRQADFVVKLGMNERQSAHYLAWADAVAARFCGSLGAVEGDVTHLWHGEIVNRRYTGRYERLAEYDFDPARDVDVDEEGVLRWSSQKPGLHAYVEAYFRSRSEARGA